MKHLLHLHITAIYTLLAQPLLSGRGLHAYKIGFTTQYFAFIYLKHFFSFLLQQIIGHHLIISFDTQFYSRKNIYSLYPLNFPYFSFVWYKALHSPLARVQPPAPLALQPVRPTTELQQTLFLHYQNFRLVTSPPFLQCPSSSSRVISGSS